jgi:hypothetical protein
MPTYLISGITQPVIVDSNNCNNGSYCKDTSRFFSKLATKLKDMATAINARIEDIKSQMCNKAGNGIFLASIDVPQMTLGIRYEYVEYIKRYGPPENGIFDETLLEGLRQEMGITNTI